MQSQESLNEEEGGRRINKDKPKVQPVITGFEHGEKGL
jgi:hypothetical protein